MAKNLVIVESPNKVNKIQSYLDPKQYHVIASVGHIRDLSTSGEYGLGVNLETMSPTYKIPREKRDLIKEIKRLAEQSDTENVLLATDPDREGEAIAWHVMDLIANTQMTKEFNLDRAKQLSFKRIIFNEITKDAILEAINNPRELNNDLVHSQESRRILDRMIGFRLSYLTKNKLQARSAGRVKSVALKLIVDKEKEIQKFVPEYWWTIEGNIAKDVNLIQVNKDLSELKFSTEAEAAKILKNLNQEFKFIKQEVKQTTVKPPKPLEMATYLMGMFTNYKLSNAASTLMSQTLYEKGLITYPRTDSTRISSASFISESEKYIKKEFGQEFYQGVPISKAPANSQDAHEAIRPTTLSVTPDNCDLKGNELKAYEFIWKTTIKSFMVDGTNNSIKDIFENNDYTFVIKRTEIKEPGFRVVDKEKNAKLKYTEGQNIKIDTEKIAVIPHETKPPARFNFGSLIKKLKEDGIGRPSTYSPTTTGLIKFNYVTNTKGSLSPTEMGIEVTDLLQKDFADIINEKYTADMENDLDSISEGKKQGEKFLKDFWVEFAKRVDLSNLNTEQKGPELVGKKCPECKGELVYRFSRFGRYIGCLNYPKCKYNEPLVKKEPPKDAGRDCPLCGKKLLIRKSKFQTEFTGCSGWPECKYVEYPEKVKKDDKK